MLLYSLFLLAWIYQLLIFSGGLRVPSPDFTMVSNPEPWMVDACDIVFWIPTVTHGRHGRHLHCIDCGSKLKIRTWNPSGRIQAIPKDYYVLTKVFINKYSRNMFARMTIVIILLLVIAMPLWISFRNMLETNCLV